MPFINKESRVKYPKEIPLEDNLQGAALHGQVGDRCFLFYREFITAWRQSPRWSTVHTMKVSMNNHKRYFGANDRVACELAWDVFFAFHVLPYESRKLLENGEVE